MGRLADSQPTSTLSAGQLLHLRQTYKQQQQCHLVLSVWCWVQYWVKANGALTGCIMLQGASTGCGHARTDSGCRVHTLQCNEWSRDGCHTGWALGCAFAL